MRSLTSFMVSVAMAEPGIGAINDMAKSIADFGITVLICAVILFFLCRILNVMVKQVNATYESILPKISEIGDMINELKNSISTTIAAHNNNSSSKLYELRVDVDNAQEALTKLVDAVSAANAQLQRLDSNIDSNQKLMIQITNNISTLASSTNVLKNKLAERPCIAKEDHQEEDE